MSAFYEGTVQHRRFAVREHTFRHRISMAYVDLDAVSALLGRRFRREDHIGDPDRPLADVVREIAGPGAPRGPVRLLTNLRTLGHCFNPVCFYYLFEPDGETVGAVVAEVTNTPWGDRHAYVRNGALGTITAVHRDQLEPGDDAVTVEFDGIGSIDLPRTFFDRHRAAGGRPDVGIDHAYAVTSYAVQGSTRSVSTSRVDATATRSETYVDITRGREENHLYLTAATDPLDGEALPRVPAAPADVAVADRLHRSTGELTAWEIANPSDGPAPGAIGR